MLSALLTPKANRGKLQKPMTKPQGCQKESTEHSQIPAPHLSPPLANTTGDRSKPSVGGERIVQNADVDFPSVQAVTSDANDLQLNIGNGRRKVVIVDDMQLAKPSCEYARKVSPSDSGVVLSPRSSPVQHSPSTAIAATNVQPPSTSAEQSPPGEQREKTALCSNEIKRGHENTTTASLPPAPTVQKQTCRPPCSTSNLKSSPLATSFSGECSSSIPTTVTNYIPMLPSTANTPTNLPRTSNYPIPMVTSPLIDNAIPVRQDGTYENAQTSSGSISAGSSSSSLQRLFQRVSQKPTPNRGFARDGRPLRGILNPTLDSANELDQYSSFPYEALPVAEPTPTFVDQPITSLVMASATSPVTALPPPSDHAPLEERDTKSRRLKQSGSSLLGSLFLRNANRGRSRYQAEAPRQQTQEVNDFPADRDVTASSYNTCTHCGSSAALREPPPSPPITRTQQLRSEAPSPPYRDNYATKPLPLPPLPPRERRDANVWSRVDVHQTSRDEDHDHDPATTQRHRRRALFALDGLTFSASTDTRDFSAFAGRQGTALRSASPLPPSSSPILERAALDETEEAGANVSFQMRPSPQSERSSERALQIGRTKMSDEAKRLFIRKGKEAEARVFSAHECAEPVMRAAVTGNEFAVSVEASVSGGSASADTGLQTANRKGVQGPESAAETAPSTLVVKKDVAWWEAAETQPNNQVKAVKGTKGDIAIEKRKAAPVEDQPSKESTLDGAMQDLEMMARTSRLRPKIRKAFEVVEAEEVLATRVSSASTQAMTDEDSAYKKEPLTTRTKKRRPPPPPPLTPVEPKDHVAASSAESQQAFSSEEKQSRQRGRHLVRDTFHRQCKAGKWDLSVRTDQVTDSISREYTETIVHIAQTHPDNQEVSPISYTTDTPGAGLNNDPSADNTISPITSSNSSSGASLNATVFRSHQTASDQRHRKGKPRQPPLDPAEAAVAVQKTADVDLTPTQSSHGSDSQGDESPESELRQKMRPPPLSLRHHSPEEARRYGAGRVVVGLGIDAEGQGSEQGRHELSSDLVGAVRKTATRPQRRRPPPPPAPPPHPPASSSTAPVCSASGSAYIPLPFTTVSSGAALQKAPDPRQRRSPPAPPLVPPSAPPSTPRRPPVPPIPPRSELRPRLGGDWSGMSLQELKRTLIAGSGNGGGRRNLESVPEEARGLFGDGDVEEKGLQLGIGKGKGVAWDDGGDDDESVYSEHDEDQFWSDDEGGTATGEESSKKTTPEKDGVWVPPSLLRVQGKKGASVDVDAGESVDEESQLLGYYLDAQRGDEERDRADAEEAKQQAESARRCEDEARAKRVANLLAKIRECDG